MIVTVVPLTVHPVAPPVSVALCCVAMQTGWVYVVPIVMVQLVVEAMAQVPPVELVTVWSRADAVIDVTLSPPAAAVKSAR